MKKSLVLLFAVLLMGGCTNRLVDFTIISTKNVDLSKGAEFERGKERIEGEDLVHWIIFIPTGVPNMKEAIDKAIESTPGCVALLDGVLYSKFWWIPYIYGQQSFMVEGTPLIDPAMAQAGTEIPMYGKIEVDRKGDIKKVEEITANEYLSMKNKMVKDSKITEYKNSNYIE